MKAICANATGTVEIQNAPKPERTESGHLLIKMHACGINPGDKAFIGRTFPIGVIVSRHDIYGVSGVGEMLEAGAGVPDRYKGKKVTIYRSLTPSDHIVGTWSEYAHVPYLDCVVLPDHVNIEDYSASLVNIITPYAFLKQIITEGHKGIISTAGASATGIAMLGICSAYNFPLISIVRKQEDKKQLEELGAVYVLAQDNANFKTQLKDLSKTLAATAVFDGIGGEILNNIIDVIPEGTTIYAYGYLGGPTPLSIHTSALMRGITLKGFSNFRSPSVKDPQLLEQALQDISSIIHMPHFKTKEGKRFKLEEIKDALAFTSVDGGRAVLYP